MSSPSPCSTPTFPRACHFPSSFAELTRVPINACAASGKRRKNAFLSCRPAVSQSNNTTIGASYFTLNSSISSILSRFTSISPFGRLRNAPRCRTATTFARSLVNPALFRTARTSAPPSTTTTYSHACFLASLARFRATYASRSFRRVSRRASRGASSSSYARTNVDAAMDVDVDVAASSVARRSFASSSARFASSSARRRGRRRGRKAPSASSFAAAGRAARRRARETRDARRASAADGARGAMDGARRGMGRGRMRTTTAVEPP